MKVIGIEVGIGEMIRATLRLCNNPQFLASLCVDIGTQAVTVNVPEVVSTCRCCKSPSSAGHRKQDSAAAHRQINSCIKCHKI